MGMAGSQGMLRRTLYTNGEFSPYMTAALAFSLLIIIAFVAFLINVLSTLGLKAVLSLVVPPTSGSVSSRRRRRRRAGVSKSVGSSKDLTGLQDL